MKPESLRIGMYYQNESGNIYKMDSPALIDALNHWQEFNKLLWHPIELTEDWLIKFNLLKRAVLTSKIPYNEYSIRDNFNIYCYMDQSGNCLFWGECNEGLDFFIVKCDTVHAFQNIYKILADKELVKETIKAWHMAHGKNASMKSNKFKEWWGKRPLSDRLISQNSKTNKFFKKLLLSY